MPTRYRTICESQRFEGERDALGLPELMDEVLKDITEALSRRPMMGQLTRQPGILAVAIDSTPMTPALVLYYGYNEHEVILLSLREADPAASEWDQL